MDPHSLHISISGCQGINTCKAIGVIIHCAAVKNNLCPRKHTECSEDSSGSFYNSLCSLALQSRQTERAAKPLALVFAASALCTRTLKLLNHQAMQATGTDHGETEKLFLFLDP